jgi:hypothetical protein
MLKLTVTDPGSLLPNLYEAEITPSQAVQIQALLVDPVTALELRDLQIMSSMLLAMSATTELFDDEEQLLQRINNEVRNRLG